MIEEIRDDIISFKTLFGKEEITNSDLILSIIEICINPFKYKHQSSPSSANFWSLVYDNQYLFHVFRKYSQDTIRKYWLLLKNCRNFDKLINTIQENTNLLNDSKCSLPCIISILLKFTDSNLENEKFSMFFDLKSKQGKKVSNKKEKSINIEKDNVTETEIQKEENIENGKEKSVEHNEEIENKEKKVENKEENKEIENNKEEKKNKEEEEEDFGKEEDENDEKVKIEEMNKNFDKKVLEMINSKDILPKFFTKFIAEEIGLKFKNKIFPSKNIKLLQKKIERDKNEL